jgi:hypothetical protein
MDHKQIADEVIKWIQLASDGFQHQVHVNMVKNIQIAHNVGTSSPIRNHLRLKNTSVPWSQLLTPTI